MRFLNVNISHELETLIIQLTERFLEFHYNPRKNSKSMFFCFFVFSKLPSFSSSSASSSSSPCVLLPLDHSADHPQHHKDKPPPHLLNRKHQHSLENPSPVPVYLVSEADQHLPLWRKLSPLLQPGSLGPVKTKHVQDFLVQVHAACAVGMLTFFSSPSALGSPASTPTANIYIFINATVPQWGNYSFAFFPLRM